MTSPDASGPVPNLESLMALADGYAVDVAADARNVSGVTATTREKAAHRRERPTTRAHRDAARDRLSEALGELLRQRDRYEAAIRWALGEGAPDDVPEFRGREPSDPPYYWRTELRNRAFPKTVSQDASDV